MASTDLLAARNKRMASTVNGAPQIQYLSGIAASPASARNFIKSRMPERFQSERRVPAPSLARYQDVRVVHHEAFERKLSRAFQSQIYRQIAEARLLNNGGGERAGAGGVIVGVVWSGDKPGILAIGPNSIELLIEFCD